MANIISVLDFIGEYNIPNRSDAPDSELINGFVTKYEPLMLTELLGADLYADMVAGLAVTPTPDVKWTILRDKCKVSIICYIYYWFRRDQATSFSGTGEIQAQNENSQVVAPTVKMVDRWNDMVRNNLSVRKFLLANESDYPDFIETLNSLPEYVWNLPFVRYYGQQIDIFTIRNQFGL